MKGIPNLIETKGRYNEKFDAVIINCSNNKPELWQKELRAKGLNWNNLFAKHAGNHYPTKVILSPEGEILGVYVNQSSSFNTTFEYELEQALK
jgi:thioredoxin-related protein